VDGVTVGGCIKCFSFYSSTISPTVQEQKLLSAPNTKMLSAPRLEIFTNMYLILFAGRRIHSIAAGDY
jgi:hypothetical protein